MYTSNNKSAVGCLPYAHKRTLVILPTGIRDSRYALVYIYLFIDLATGACAQCRLVQGTYPPYGRAGCRVEEPRARDRNEPAVETPAPYKDCGHKAPTVEDPMALLVGEKKKKKNYQRHWPRREASGSLL
jgi:hypothetical protein